MSKIDVDLLFNRITALRKKNVEDAPKLFWADYVNVVTTLCYSENVCVVSVLSHQGFKLEPVETHSVDSINQPVPTYDFNLASKTVLDMVLRCMSNAFALSKSDELASTGCTWIAFKLTQFSNKVLLISLPPAHAENMKEVVVRGRLLADIPSSSAALRASHEPDVAPSFLPILSVLPSVYASKTLPLSSLKLVNELVSSSDDIDQAVVGWLKGDRIVVSHISHMDRFENNMALVKSFEAALEESFDQEVNISLSTPNETVVQLAHQKLQREIGCDDIASIVIYDSSDQAIGCLLLVKMQGKIPERLIDAVAFILNIASSKFEELYIDALGIVGKFKKGLEKKISFILGKEWLWTKVTVLILLVLLSWIIFGAISFRIESNGEFTTDKTLLISTSQDGVVSTVYSDIGDEVTAGQKLLELKKQDLILQLTELEAEKQRYLSEEDKARAFNNIVDSEISKARRLQVEAKINRVKLKIEDAVMLAPFDGVVVEGERKDLIGLPVRKGDTLMKVAKIEGLYLTLWVDERDIHFVTVGDQGEFALVSQPLEPIRFTVERVVPMAAANGKGSQFQIKAKLLDTAQTWWRPGMTGIAKIDKGDKPPYWVFGHQSYYQLRLLLWW